MNKFDYYIYYNITEVAYTIYKKSKYVTFTNWCKSMTNSMLLMELSDSEIKTLSKISEKIELIFALTKKESNQYIIEYFFENKCSDFEYLVVKMKVLWGFSIN